MAVLNAVRDISNDRVLLVSDFQGPVRRADVQPTGDRRQLDQVIKRVFFVMVQNDNLISEKLDKVLFCVQIEPVFKAVPAEFSE